MFWQHVVVSASTRYFKILAFDTSILSSEFIHRNVSPTDCFRRSVSSNSLIYIQIGKGEVKSGGGE